MALEARADDELAGEQDRSVGADLPILDEPYPCESCELAKACAARLLSCRAFGEYVAGASEAAWRAAERWPDRRQWQVLFDPEALRTSRRRPRSETVMTCAGTALLTTKAAAAALGVRRETIVIWCRAGAPRATVGRARKGVPALFDLAALQAWIAVNRPDFASRPKHDPAAPPLTPEQRCERQRLAMKRLRDRQRGVATAS